MGKRIYDIAFKLNAKMGSKYAKTFAQAESKAQQLAATFDAVGKRMSLKVTAPIKAIGIASVLAAKNWESAWVGVRKVTKASEEELQALEETARRMARELPHTHNAIASVFEAGSRLGVATEYLEKFSRTMLAVEATTTLSLESAADGFAILANIMGTCQSQFDRMGSTILYLGSNFATTEADILKMSQNMAGAAAQARLSEADVMGLSTAISSIGLSSSAGASAFSGFINDMGMAVALGGDRLNDFARVAGMSADEFARKFERDAVSAVTAFIGGLNRLEDQGENVLVTLDDMGLSGIYMSQMLLGLSGAYDTMIDAIDRSNTAWEENSFLMYAVEERYATVEARMQVMRNQLRDAGITIGEALMPHVETLIGGITNLAEWFSNLDEGTQRNIIRFAMLAAAIGPGLIVISKLIKLYGKLKAAKAAMSLATIKFSGVTGATTISLGKKKIALGLVGKAIGRYNAMLTKGIFKLSGYAIASKKAAVGAGILTKGLVFVKLAFIKLTIAMLANPIGLIIAGVAALVVGIVALIRWVNRGSEEYREQRRALEELTEQNDKLLESHQRLIDSYNEGIASIENEAQSAEILIGRLEKLSSQTHLTAAEQQQMAAIAEDLNSRFPELALSIDETTGAMSHSVAAIRALAQAEAEYQRQKAKRAAFTEAIIQQAELEEQLTRALEVQADALRSYNAIGGGNLNPFDWSYSRARDLLNDTTEEVERLQAAIEENLALQAETEQQWEEIARAAEEAARAMVSQEDAVSRVIGSMSYELQALAAAYDEAFKAAHRSVQGQFNIWDTAAEVIPKSIDAVTAAMESQIAHWQAYNANLNTLSERAGDFEGLSEMISTFADGSPQSIAMIAGLADALENAAYDEIAAMISSWKTLQEEQEAVGHSIAELTTDFSAGLDEIEGRMLDAINNMNMYDDAAAAARLTIQAYIDEIRSMTGDAHSAASAVAAATSNALRGTNNIGNVGSYTGRAYAKGTSSAMPGWALVGEQGPELVNFRGGEAVYTAAETGNIFGNLSRGASYFYTTMGNLTGEDSPSSSGNKPKPVDAMRKLLDGGTNYSSSFELHYSPVINNYGQGGLDNEELEEILRRDKDGLEDRLDRWWEEKIQRELRLANA